VLDTLIDARLLTSYEVPPAEDEDTGGQKIEIIHESLLSAWPRLIRWQTQDTEGAQLRDELRQVAQMWDQHDRSADLLWTGTAFQEYQLWRDRYPGGLSELEEEFARAMESHAERRRRRRRIALAAVIGALLVVVGVIGGFWRRAVGETQRAEAANLFALAQLRLEEHPTAALAYAIGSLELADNPEVRLMVVDALWRGPTELRLATSSPFSVDFSPDGRWLSTANRAGGGQLWPADGGPPTLLEDSETIFEGRISPRGDVIAHNQPTEAKKIGLWTFPAGRFLRWLDLGGTYNQQFWFSPDGSRLITSTETLEGDDLDVEIRSWPIEGGDPDLVARLEASRESSATFFGVDPTESLLGWVDGTRFNIRPLAAGSAHPVSTITLEHGRAINSAVFDAEGEHVATADGVGTIRIWSLEQDPPELIRAVEAGGLLAPWSLRFDPSGMMVGAAGGYLGDLTAPPDAEWQRLRRAAGAIETETAEGGFSVAFHPESEWFATGHYYSVSLWPLARSYPRILQGHENNVRDVKFSPDGKWLVSSSTDGSVRQWPLEGNSNQRSKILYQAEGAFDTPYWLAMAPDGSFVATGTMNGAVWVLPLDGGPARELGTLDDLISSVAVGPRARLVAAGAGSDNRDEAAVRVWDLATGETRVLDAGDRKAIGRLAFTPQGDLVISSGSLLRLWDLQAAAPELREEIEISDSETPEGPLLGIHPELRRVLYRVEGRLWVYDMDARVARELDSQGREVGPAVFDTKGEVLVSTEKTGIIRVERGSGGEPHLLIGHEVSGVNSLDVSADGRWIASAGGDKTIRLWPMPDLEKPPLHTLPHDELLAKLRSLTNLRVVEDPGSPSGWKLEVGPFPGWEEVPTW
jgi:WD40 repeat protein